MMWGFVEEQGARQNPDGSLYHSPFLSEPFAGLQRFNDKGSVWKMMSLPGARGLGLHVGVYAYPECCWGSYGYFAHRIVGIKSNTPLLLPSVVEWVSIIDTDTKPYESIRDNYGVDYPCVGISSVTSPWSDYRWALDNLNYDYDACIESYEPEERMLTFNPGDLHFEIIGLVPIWTVMPASMSLVNALKQSIIQIGQQTNYGILHDCWCTIDYVECDSDCESWQKQPCNCTARDQVTELLETTIHEPVNPRKFMPPDIVPFWNRAVEKFYDGWRTIHELEKGEPWACYSQLQQSPFWDLPGPGNLEQQIWTDSTNSEMLQESLPAS